MYHLQTKMIIILITLDYIYITGSLVSWEIFNNIRPVEGFGKIWPKLAHFMNKYLHCELEVHRPKARF